MFVVNFSWNAIEYLLICLDDIIINSLNLEENYNKLDEVLGNYKMCARNLNLPCMSLLEIKSFIQNILSVQKTFVLIQNLLNHQ